MTHVVGTFQGASVGAVLPKRIEADRGRYRPCIIFVSKPLSPLSPILIELQDNMRV